MLQQRSCEPITSTGYNERLIVFISSVKKMFKMFTVGEMAIYSSNAMKINALKQGKFQQKLKRVNLILNLSIRFSFSNGLLCVRFWNFDEEEWHGNLRDNVIQSENKISEKKQPQAQGKKLFNCFFSYSNTCTVYLPVYVT